MYNFHLSIVGGRAPSLISSGSLYVKFFTGTPDWVHPTPVVKFFTVVRLLQIHSGL